jgi:hypothetical protein
MTRIVAILAFLAFHCLAAPGAMAGDAAVGIELNKLEPSGAACRAYLVLRNATTVSFESLKLDLVMFDTDGVVARRIAVETAPLPVGKTSLKVFDIGGMPCGKMQRVLLNDILTCESGGSAMDDCLPRVTVSARGPVPFIK